MTQTADSCTVATTKLTVCPWRVSLEAETLKEPAIRETKQLGWIYVESLLNMIGEKIGEIELISSPTTSLRYCERQRFEED